MNSVHKLHIFPVIALVFLTFGIMVLMWKRRFAAIRSGKIPAGFFKDFQQREPFLIPEEVQIASRNYANLFEVPVLFYAYILALVYCDKADNVSLFLSWLFVLSRYAHSYVHVTTNRLMHRARIFAVGSFIMILLWGRLFLQLFQS
jgi:hypothetical protein